MIGLVFWWLLICSERNELVESRFIYKKFTATMHAEFIQANLTVGSLNALSTLSADLVVLKTLDSNFQIRSTMSELRKSGKRLLVATPRLPYCDLLIVSMALPIVSDVIRESLKFGNFPATCPILPGHYYMTNFFVNDSKLPVQKLLKINNTYLVESWFWDKLRTSPVQIFKFNAIFDFLED